MSNGKCAEVDMCLNKPCDLNSACSTTGPGTYICICKNGYENDPKNPNACIAYSTSVAHSSFIQSQSHSNIAHSSAVTPSSVAQFSTLHAALLAQQGTQHPNEVEARDKRIYPSLAEASASLHHGTRDINTPAAASTSIPAAASTSKPAAGKPDRVKSLEDHLSALESTDHLSVEDARILQVQSKVDQLEKATEMLVKAAADETNDLKALQEMTQSNLRNADPTQDLVNALIKAVNGQENQDSRKQATIDRIAAQLKAGGSTASHSTTTATTSKPSTTTPSTTTPSTTKIQSNTK